MDITKESKLKCSVDDKKKNLWLRIPNFFLSDNKKKKPKTKNP